MPLYSYKAIDARGKRILGRVEAVNLFDLDQRLARMDLDLVVGAPSHLKARLLGGGIRRQDLRQARRSANSQAGRLMPLAFLHTFFQMLAGFSTGADQRWIGLAQMALSTRFGRAASPALG